MRNAKRWILIAAIAAVPFATASCRIPLANGCRYEFFEPYTSGVDPLTTGLALAQHTVYNFGVVC